MNENISGHAPEKLIKMKEVITLTSFSKSEIYRKINSGNFPKPIKIGKRASRFSETEVNNWIEKAITAQRKPPATPGNASGWINSSGWIK